MADDHEYRREVTEALDFLPDSDVDDSSSSSSGAGDNFPKYYDNYPSKSSSAPGPRVLSQGPFSAKDRSQPRTAGSQPKSNR